jgi:hypothetical protein
MTGQDRPVWWEPGMSEADIAVYEAADRCAERGYREAPIRPGDDIALRLQALFADFPARVRDRHASRERKRPAA